MPQVTDDETASATADVPTTADAFRTLIHRAQEASETGDVDAADDAVTDTVETVDEPAHSWGTRRQVLRVTVAAITVAALVAATVVAVLYGLADAHHRAVSSAERAATVAARQDAVYVSSYDYRSLDQAFARVTANATGSFKDDFAKTSKALEPTITKAKATATGTVQDIAVQSGGTSSVVLLAFVDQKLTTSAGSTPQTVTNRLVITMSKQHGHWLMSNVVTV
jgi:Mce-associated membrane protein